jgi:hypothetical protein
MTFTSLLDPASALRIAWALTGSFSDDVHSRQTALAAEKALQDIQGAAAHDPKENEYVTGVIGAIQASMRSLDVVYKSRQDNFKETEQLRASYMQSITESLEFGKKAEDFLKSLPTMTIAAAGGVTIGQVLGLSTTSLLILAFGLAAAGYLVNLWFVSQSRKRTQIQLIHRDYDRNLYYKQYIDRVADVLNSLYYDLDRLHRNAFGQLYPTGKKSAYEIVHDLLEGVQPTLCKLAHEHIRAGKITPELWPICETGNPEALKTCPYWKSEAGNDR